MTELWEPTFAEKQMMLGAEPSRSAVFARDYFARVGAKAILIPGIGYGRNAKPFLPWSEGRRFCWIGPLATEGLRRVS